MIIAESLLLDESKSLRLAEFDAVTDVESGLDHGSRHVMVNLKILYQLVNLRQLILGDRFFFSNLRCFHQVFNILCKVATACGYIQCSIDKRPLFGHLDDGIELWVSIWLGKGWLFRICRTDSSCGSPTVFQLAQANFHLSLYPSLHSGVPLSTQSTAPGSGKSSQLLVLGALAYHSR